jgi:hypothetical protein
MLWTALFSIAALSVELTEYRQPAHQAKILVDRHAIVDAAFGANCELWAIESSALWRWQVDDRLSNLKIPDTKSKFLQLGFDGRSTYVGGSHEIVAIGTQPLQLMRYALSTSVGAGVRFSQTADAMTWFTEVGTFQLDRYAKVIRSSSEAFPLGSHVVAQPKTEHIWLASGRKLWRHENGSKPAFVHAASSAFLGLANWQNSIVAYTSDAVFFFDSKGKLQKTVLVAKGRKILTAHFFATAHTFLMDDGSLESFDISAAKPSYFRLPPAVLVKLQKIDRCANRLAVLSDGALRLYDLPEDPKPLGN